MNAIIDARIGALQSGIDGQRECHASILQKACCMLRVALCAYFMVPVAWRVSCKLDVVSCMMYAVR